jgi:hypothetical protein
MVFAAFYKYDLEKVYSFFEDKAVFRNASMTPGDPMTLDKSKTDNNSF